MTEEPRESSVLEGVRKGRPEALAALYVEHADAVMRVAYRISGSVEEAEDVVHDVFLGLPEALGRYREVGSFGAWLRRVATRVALTRLRRVNSRRETTLETDDANERVPRVDRDPTDVMALETALAALSDSLRVVFVLKEVEGYSHKEIGAMLGIRAGTSEVRFHRALKKLRELLGDAT